MKLLLKIIIPFGFILFAFLCVKLLIGSKPKNLPRTPEVIAPQVDVIEVAPGNHQPPVISYGTVQSYFETTLVPQVNGQIVEVAETFRVGNHVKKGEILARIDDTDYAAALAGESSRFTEANRALVEEEVKARQAAQDWLASGRELSEASDFVLRKPQLEAARAHAESAMAAEAKAKADLQRTIIRAPYDAVVLERQASLGNYANQQQPLGKLVATERVEVRLPLTADQAARVQLSSVQGENASSGLVVTLSSATKKGVEWQGQLVRAEPSVDPKNQVTYVIAEVESPYENKPEPLVVGTFVNVCIPAQVITNAFKVPEAALVNDAYVWGVDKVNCLNRIKAARVYGHEGHVYLRLASEDLAKSGMDSRLRLVTRPLATFRVGKEVEPVSALPQTE